MRKTETIIKLMSDVLDKKQLNQLRSVMLVVLNEGPEAPENVKLLENFKVQKTLIGLSEKTIAQYEFEIRQFMKFFDGNLAEATNADIKSYLWIYREKYKVSMVTIENKLRYLSSFYEFLLNEELISKNPVRSVGKIIVPIRLKEAFSPEDIEAIRDACCTTLEQAIVEFLYSSGARVSECANLRVSNINFEKCEAKIIGKGNKERIVYFSLDAKDCMLKLLGERFSISSDYLFLNYSGNKISSAAIEAMCRKLGRYANVKNVHPHRFRRTFATELWRKGVPIEHIKILLGHESIQTTLRYIDIDLEKVRESYIQAM